MVPYWNFGCVAHFLHHVHGGALNGFRELLSLIGLDSAELTYLQSAFDIIEGYLRLTEKDTRHDLQKTYCRLAIEDFVHRQINDNTFGHSSEQFGISNCVGDTCGVDRAQAFVIRRCESLSPCDAVLAGGNQEPRSQGCNAIVLIGGKDDTWKSRSRQHGGVGVV
jgi:hypothetical protein